MQQLLATFKVEAEEHLGAMSSLALELERAPPAADTSRAIETLFRETHSLKGAARAVNLAHVERVCQALERVLAALKRQELAVSRAFFEALHASLDGLSRLLAHLVGGHEATDPSLASALARSLDALLAAPAPAAPLVAPLAAPATTEAQASPLPAGDTVRLATAKLDALMTQAEELQAFKYSGDHLMAELRSLSAALADWKRQCDKRARAARALRRALASAGERSSVQQRGLAQLLDADEHDELLAKALADRMQQLERAGDRRERAL
ncbi:MAG TPA: Hpt domain-containing protein, partial [Albitalea sp.]|nr:Hpt domain-containing protein [Albitalea sp.]